ncbi:cytochrome P450 17A1, partial [Podospora appendiculata]
IMSAASLFMLFAVGVVLVLALRIVYCLRFHPLSRFHGPWYAASSSLVMAIVSWRRREPEWLLGLAKKYGRHAPIRIAPSLLLFPNSSALKDIYKDPDLNVRSRIVYSTGMTGPVSLSSTLDAEEHRELRKALGGPQWSIGALKKVWEARIDELITLFTGKATLAAMSGREVVLSDKCAEFAADVMTVVSFSEPWGFVKNDRDEKHILESWRKSLDVWGFVGRFGWLRENVFKSSLSVYLLPKTDDDDGMGYLRGLADRLVTERERQIEEERFSQDKPDILQYTLEARSNGEPLSPVQKRAHMTLVIQAGADTTGTGLGNTLRFLLTHPSCLEKARAEISAAEAAGYLSCPIQYEETRAHLPYFVACIKESLRVNPPAPQVLPRVVGSKGATISGVFVPGGTDVMCHASVVQRDPELYGPDPEAFRPERWLESERQSATFDASSMVFGLGPRVCLGRDIALMEMHKLLPEIVRRFDIELLDEGKVVVAGGVAYNQGLVVKFRLRE